MRICPTSGALLLVTACYAGPGANGADPGQDTETGGETGPPDTGDGSSSGTGTGETADDTGEDVDCDAGPHVSDGELVRLTLRQYDNTVRDLLGIDNGIAQATFAADIFLGEESKFTVGAPVSPLVAKQLVLGAEAIADEVDLAQLTSCAAATCADEFIATLGRRSFRRPLSDVERGALRDVYDAAPDHDAGAHAVIEAILQAPAFVFLFVPQTADAAPGDVVPLDDYALASRLSYFLWNTMPDDSLLDAADAGQLGDRDGLENQLDRMLADPRAHEGVVEFYDAVVQLRFVGTVTKNPDVYPDFSAELAQDLQTSLRLGLTALHLADTPGTLQDLAVSLPMFANDRLATFYGLPAGGADFEPTQTRGGLLSHPAMAALLGKPTEPAIVARGLFVRDSLLCDPLPEPPPGVEAEFPEPDGESTPRERFEEHRSDPTCAVCHDRIDPVGYAMEHLDSDGRTRQEYPTGQAIDASGDFLIGASSTPFSDLEELEAILADEPAFAECLTEHWLSFATRRVPGELDACTLEDIAAAVSDADGDVSQLVRATVLSDGFRYLRVPDIEGGE